MTDKASLCFALYSSIEIQSYYDLPTDWTVMPTIKYDDEKADSSSTTYEFVEEDDKKSDISIEYKMTNMFYRYNVQKSSNISLSNLIIRNGYLL